MNPRFPPEECYEKMKKLLDFYISDLKESKVRDNLNSEKPILNSLLDLCEEYAKSIEIILFILKIIIIKKNNYIHSLVNIF